jgi:hypothetical protein
MEQLTSPSQSAPNKNKNKNRQTSKIVDLTVDDKEVDIEQNHGPHTHVKPKKYQTAK